MEKIDSTKQIIERLKEKGTVNTEMTPEELQTAWKDIQDNMELTKAIAKIDSPKEREQYINEIFRQKEGNIRKSEIELLISAYIDAKIKLGEYLQANRWLRWELTDAKLEEGDYYAIDKLVLTERKLGNIRDAKKLATVALQNSPEHVSLRNELIHIALLEGNKERARRLLDKQKQFYEQKRKLKTAEILSYQREEEETGLLEEKILGEEEEQNSK